MCVCVCALIRTTRISFPLYSFKIITYYFKMKEAGVLFDIIPHPHLHPLIRGWVAGGAAQAVISLYCSVVYAYVRQ